MSGEKNSNVAVALTEELSVSNEAVSAVSAPGESSAAPTDAASSNGSNTGDAPVRRGRGRPSKVTAPVDKSVALKSNPIDGAPVRRGRGRPPKGAAPVDKSVALKTNPIDGAPIRRGRGRPPKVAAPVDKSVALKSNPIDGAPVRRGRGRPPKVAAPVDKSVALNSNPLGGARRRMKAIVPLDNDDFDEEPEHVPKRVRTTPEAVYDVDVNLGGQETAKTDSAPPAFATVTGEKRGRGRPRKNQ